MACDTLQTTQSAASRPARIGRFEPQRQQSPRRDTQSIYWL